MNISLCTIYIVYWPLNSECMVCTVVPLLKPLTPQVLHHKPHIQLFISNQLLDFCKFSQRLKVFHERIDFRQLPW